MVVPIYMSQLDKMGQCHSGILGRVQFNQMCFYFDLWIIVNCSFSSSKHLTILNCICRVLNSGKTRSFGLKYGHSRRNRGT